MDFNYFIAIFSLTSSMVAMAVGLRFYVRFGRQSGQWGWLVMTVSTVSLTISEVFDAFTTFQGDNLSGLADGFAILTEILLTIGFVRMFNHEMVEDKNRQKRLEVNLAESEKLLSATKQMTSSLNLKATLQTLLQRTITLVDADFAVLYLGNQYGNLTSKYFGVSRNNNQMNSHEQELGNFTQQILSTGRPILIEDIPDKLDHLPKKIQGRISAFGGFPLWENKEILGVLFVVFEKAHRFEIDQQVLLASIADHGVLALRNAILYEQINEQSRTDSLTGLANRRQLDETLANELSRARRYGDSLSLVICDIDHFKQINDTFGHPAGDAALRHIADLFRKYLRLTDFAGRIGGDEMAIILPKTEPVDAAQLTERLREIIQNTSFIWEDKAVQLTCSFGISGGIGEILPVESSDLYKKGDEALYMAKLEGRNCVIKL